MFLHRRLDKIRLATKLGVSIYQRYRDARPAAPRRGNAGPIQESEFDS